MRIVKKRTDKVVKEEASRNEYKKATIHVTVDPGERGGKETATIPYISGPSSLLPAKPSPALQQPNERPLLA
jgi:hypothetical protein